PFPRGVGTGSSTNQGASTTKSIACSGSYCGLHDCLQLLITHASVNFVVYQTSIPVCAGEHETYHTIQKVKTFTPGIERPGLCLRPTGQKHRECERGVGVASGGFHNPEGAFPTGLWHNSVVE